MYDTGKPDNSIYVDCQSRGRRTDLQSRKEKGHAEKHPVQSFVRNVGDAKLSSSKFLAHFEMLSPYVTIVN